MPKIKFVPQNEEYEVPENCKILAAAIKNKIPIRYGCGACRCGTCAVAVQLNKEETTTLSAMDQDEQAMLEKMKLATDGSVRLACKTKVQAGYLTVDLDFQDTYSPDDGDEFSE